MLAIVIICIMFFIFFICRTSKMKLHNPPKTKKLDSVYHNMKSGDVLIVDKNMYVLYKKNNQIMVITKGINNYIELDPVKNILNKYKNKKILWLSLKGDLTDLQLKSLKTAIHQYYPYTQKVSVIFIHNNEYREEFKLSEYTSKILFSIDLLNLGNAFECISDPILCLNQPQKYSMYVHENKFNENIINII